MIGLRPICHCDKVAGQLVHWLILLLLDGVFWLRAEILFGFQPHTGRQWGMPLRLVE